MACRERLHEESLCHARSGWSVCRGGTAHFARQGGRRYRFVCQKNLTCEDFGNELCHRRHLRSVANNPAECRELRCDVFTSLIDGYTDSRIASDIPKIHRLSVKHACGGAKEDTATL